jgi:aldehyde:ferredoxin oxidoreductase
MGLSQFGTGMLIPIAYKIGYLPTRNLSKYDWPQNEIYDNVKLKKNPAYEFKKNPCFACPIGHCKDMIFKEGKYKGKVIDEPEYEAWQGFSGLIGVTDVDETAMLATLNDELGLDLKEMCYTLAWAIECYEKGYLTKKDTDGLELTWGNVEAIRELMHKIALREGFGAILAEGVMRASKRYGGPAADCAVYCKRGAAPHIHDPRGNYSVALAQAFGENGSIYGAVDRSPNPEMGYPEGVPFTDSEAHPILLARGTWKVAFQDIYMICNFAAINYPLMFECLNALTGWNVDEEEGKQMGYRMATLARAYNILQGAKAEEDTLSKKLLDPIADGPNKGKSLGLVIDDARKKYYKEMGWNEETSYPLPETLRKYDLEYVMKDLY